MNLLFSRLVSIVAFLILAAVAIEILAAYDTNLDRSLADARLLVRSISLEGWQFLRPLLQLIIVFLILDWIAARIGFQFKLEHLKGSWNIQTFIAGLIIVTYCIAVLADIPAVNSLKDVVLIVIGFYFGTKSRAERVEGSGTVIPDTRSDAGAVPPSSDPGGQR